jgi:hypothetical protein
MRPSVRRGLLFFSLRQWAWYPLHRAVNPCPPSFRCVSTFCDTGMTSLGSQADTDSDESVHGSRFPPLRRDNRLTCSCFVCMVKYDTMWSVANHTWCIIIIISLYGTFPGCIEERGMSRCLLVCYLGMDTLAFATPVSLSHAKSSDLCQPRITASTIKTRQVSIIIID